MIFKEWQNKVVKKGESKIKHLNLLNYLSATFSRDPYQYLGFK